jgi:hypothetical protein
MKNKIVTTAAFVDYASRDRGAVLHAGRGDKSGRGLFAARLWEVAQETTSMKGQLEFQKAAEQHGLRIIKAPRMPATRRTLYSDVGLDGWCYAGTEQLPS